MDMIDALVKRLVEDDDLLKGVTPRKGVKKLLEHLRNAKNEKLSPEQRQASYENALHIVQTGKEKVSAESRASNLDKLMTAAKGKTASAADKKLAEIAARHNLKPPEEKEQPVTPGSDATLSQIKASAARAAIDPKAIPKRHYEEAEKKILNAPKTMIEQGKTEQAKRMLRSKFGSQAKESLDLVHKLHGMGDTDSAHELYNAIPKNFLPKALHDYDPAYMHYQMTPDMWSHPATPPDVKQAVHNVHKQVLAGELDNHPEYVNVAPKVKALKAPKTQM